MEAKKSNTTFPALEKCGVQRSHRVWSEPGNRFIVPAMVVNVHHTILCKIGSEASLPSSISKISSKGGPVKP